MPYYIKHRPSKKKEKPLPLFDKVGIKIKKKPDLVARLDKVFSRYIRLRGPDKAIRTGRLWTLPFTPPHGHTL